MNTAKLPKASCHITMSLSECAICIESFNKSTRKRVICPYCPTDGTETPTCLSCVKTYLLQDDAPTPRCAACRAGWTEDFMTHTFPKSWLLKNYKAHRERILLDTERARLPEAQEDAGRYRRALQVLERINAQIAPIMERMKQLPELQAEKDAYDAYLAANVIRNTEERNVSREAEHFMELEQKAMTKLDILDVDARPFDDRWCAEIEALSAENLKRIAYMELREARAQYEEIQRGFQERRAFLRNEENRLWRAFMEARNVALTAKAPLRQEINALQTREYRDAQHIKKSVGSAPVARTGVTTEAERSRWTFVMKCPLTDCEGFVGTNWKCGLCEAEFCKECGDQCRKHTNAEEHVCDPEIRSTHQALRKESKPCPKCAAMISKIDGCDQMWCTQCQTAFSWRTGQIETSHIHNPHYFQWMRQTGATAPLRPVGDCLNLEPEELIDQVIHYGARRQQWNIVEWARQIRHYRFEYGHHQRTLQEKQNDDWRRQLRVKRLVNEITDDIWKDRLQRGEKATQKEFAVVQVMDLFLQAGLDILRNTLPDDADVQTLIEQIEALRKFCNEEMDKIGRRFNNNTVYFAIPRPTRRRLLAVD